MDPAKLEMTAGPFRRAWIIEQNSAVEAGHIFGEFVEIVKGTRLQTYAPTEFAETA